MKSTEELELAKEKIKVKKWEWIPVLGTMVYMIRTTLFYQKLETKVLRRAFVINRIMVQVPLVLSSLPFLITFFVYRKTGSYGEFPWMIWVSIGLGLIQLAPTIMWYALWKNAVKKAEATLNTKIGD